MEGFGRVKSDGIEAKGSMRIRINIYIKTFKVFLGFEFPSRGRTGLLSSVPDISAGDKSYSRPQADMLKRFTVVLVTEFRSGVWFYYRYSLLKA